MAVATVPERPVRLVVADDLRRNRLTVLFRLVLAIPHLVWLALWGIAVSIVTFVLWLAVLFTAQVPEVLHDFVARWLRYATHVSAYLYLVADPYPGFLGRPGYPVDLEIDPPARQSRWTGAFRGLLAIPAFFLASQLGAGLTLSAVGGLYFFIVLALTMGGVAGGAAFLSWFASLALGRSPRGLRDLTATALGYGGQTGAYLLLLTGRYPSADPGLAEPYADLPEHPLRIVVVDDLVRPRLTVLFRFLLATPHFIWLSLWAVAVFFAAVAAWFAALATGRVPSALHRFLAAYVRYATHVFAFVYLVGRRFPGFAGRAGSYAIDLEVAPPEPQNRWKTLFRLVLAVPTVLLVSALGGVAFVVAFLAWWYAFVTGRMPEGLRNLGATCLRYSAQATAYLLLVTDRYPFASPLLEPPGAAIDMPSPLPSPGEEPDASPQRRDILPILIICGLVATALIVGILGIRSLAGPQRGVIRILAPDEGCWSIAVGQTEDEIGAITDGGCGPRSLEFDVSDGLAAQLSAEPPTAVWNMGVIVLVDGEVVRRVTPGPRGGLPIRIGENVPERAIVMRVDAAPGGCWKATIDNAIERGCGPRSFPFRVKGTVSVILERQRPGSWPLALAFVLEGQVRQTFGPITDDYPLISGGYTLPREDG